MAGRRVVNEQKQAELLEQNPHLARFETRIEVARGEGKKRPEPEAELEEEIADGKMGKLPPFEADVTLDGEEVESFTATSGKPNPDVTEANFVDFGTGFMFAGNMPMIKIDDEIANGGSGGSGGSGGGAPDFDVLTLSEDGFGVAEADGGKGGKGGKKGKAEEESGESEEDADVVLDGDEAIILDVLAYMPPPPPGKGGGKKGDSEEENEETLEYFDMGGVSLDIDYKVLAGTGLIKIELIDYDALPRAEGEDDGSFEFEVLVGGRRDAREGTLEAEMPDDMSAFDVAIITVEGEDLEVTLTGLSLVTNSEGMEFT